MTGEIVPDDKDWTWVLERPCAECGFDGGSFRADRVGDAIRDTIARWATVLARPVADLRTRPRPDRWSDLEYAAHVRDVFELFGRRLDLMLQHDDPVFANWDQDDTADAENYNAQDPSTVAADLVAAGEALAVGFDAVDGARWRRTGRRSDGAAFTVESFARYLIHDPVHHLWDVDG